MRSLRCAVPRAMILACVALGSAGCSRKHAQPPPPPPRVGVLTVAPADVPETFEFPAQVQPYREVQVRARVDGIIVSRPFTEGADVRPGRLLYQLDKVRYEAEYQSALAHFRNAEATFQRLEPLLATHAVAQQDVDNARAANDAAKAALDAAKKDLDDTQVRAEIAGRVGRTRIDVGGRVTGPADLLTTIDQLDPIYVTFEPSAEQLQEWQSDPRSASLIRPGSDLAVRVVMPDSTLLPQVGRLDFVAATLNATTGTQEFRAVFPNQDRSLVPGEFVRVRLVGFQRQNAMAVPQRAVQTGLGRQFIYVVGRGDTVTARDVQTGPWNGSQWIIDRGLNPGDRVVVDGVQRIGPGRPVTPVPVGAGGGGGQQVGGGQPGGGGQPAGGGQPGGGAGGSGGGGGK